MLSPYLDTLQVWESNLSFLLAFIIILLIFKYSIGKTTTIYIIYMCSLHMQASLFFFFTVIAIHIINNYKEKKLNYEDVNRIHVNICICVTYATLSLS